MKALRSQIDEVSRLTDAQLLELSTATTALQSQLEDSAQQQQRSATTAAR